MQSIQENLIVDLLLQNAKTIHFPEGLGGFENVADFTLYMHPSEAPLIWLVAQNYPKISFLTIDPFMACPEYQPEFLDEDLDALNIKNADTMFVLCIAHLNKKPSIGLTINLKAPIVINWVTGQGKQLIIQNHKSYALEYQPLAKHTL